MKLRLIILPVILVISCTQQQESQSNVSEISDANLNKEFEGELFADFNIFNGNGIDLVYKNEHDQFPKIERIEKKDSLIINFWFDGLLEGNGTLKFRKKSNYFYRIDTLEFDGQKSIWYEYHTDDYILQFEKYFSDKNQSPYKLTASLLTDEKFKKFDLTQSDSANIGYNSNFLLEKTASEESVISTTSIDEINPRARLNNFSIFWHYFICSGKYWIGYGVSCHYLD